MKRPLHLFEGFGVEIEYMIVDRERLTVLPVADQVLTAQAGELTDEVEVGALAWSNELVLHVIELKTNGPAARLEGLASTFQEHVGKINRHLGPLGGMLLPGGMHPSMDPLRETLLWPHDNSPIYQAYDRIFGCRGHGWANLQSVHLNLPFASDEEFGRLHAAIRLVLPILPALAASSPLLDGRSTGLLDNRLEVYRLNQRLVPSVTGRVIPEPVFSPRAYREEVLETMYREIAARDPEAVLQHEWLNSRGAIARFERNTIEIRLLDVQECPAADLAIVSLLVALLRALVGEEWLSYAEQQLWSVAELEPILLATIRDGEAALIEDRRYLEALGVPEAPCRAGQLWRRLAERCGGLLAAPQQEALELILRSGTLARRLVQRLGPAPTAPLVVDCYRELGACLAEGRLFDG
ncbi:glutamate-cysteine ligase family protein [Desulfuromonas carbonis]|uniref:carboxylate-amine ligase n=1 Tax=Desulfuromonas sp. DDH964 TaxID=1823759 RepID=UPI00078CFF79|nr:glutamate-cysteine ligase family protein [Desulfuromonas sp. DDH964]AMV70810.1 Carboxylate-amine ligase YbdK [Desulfuromonas sp. DDH964]